jgi:hypothetical protein
MLRNRFSRYPYYDEDGETVLGVIHLKDLFFAQQAGKPVMDLPFPASGRNHRRAHPRAGAVPPLPRWRAPLRPDRRKGKRPLGFVTLDNLARRHGG